MRQNRRAITAPSSCRMASVSCFSHTGPRRSGVFMPARSIRKRAAVCSLRMRRPFLCLRTTFCSTARAGQAEMFPIFVQWGATPVYALRMATTVNAEIIHKQDSLGTIEKGKFADLIAGDSLKDITEMQRVKFVMKGGETIKNEL